MTSMSFVWVTAEYVLLLKRLDFLIKWSISTLSVVRVHPAVITQKCLRCSVRPGWLDLCWARVSGEVKGAVIHRWVNSRGSSTFAQTGWLNRPPPIWQTAVKSLNKVSTVHLGVKSKPVLPWFRYVNGGVVPKVHKNHRFLGHGLGFVYPRVIHSTPTPFPLLSVCQPLFY